MPETSPAEIMRSAATMMRERAEAASPGPWHQMCMGSDGCQVLNDGHLRERKHVAWSGRKEWKADHADAEYIASMHPLVALAVAGWLNETALDAAENVKADTPECVHAEPPCDCDTSPRWGCDRCSGWLGADCHCWDDALSVARTYLGESNA